MNKKWEIYQTNEEKVEKLQEKYKLNRLLSTLLTNRGIIMEIVKKTSLIKKLTKFLNPKRSDFYDPFGMPDMEKAAERILKAIKDKEQIIIYGDYDVDGITSVTVLKSFLEERGIQVNVYIPNRLNEGYGLNKEAIKKIFDQGYTLMITVDCGISGIEEIDYANSLGIETINFAVLTKLESLDVSDSYVPELDFSICPDLQLLNAMNTGFGNPDATTDNEDLPNIDIDLKSNAKLKDIDMSMVNVNVLTLPENDIVANLSASNSAVTQIVNLEKQLGLETLNIAGIGISALDLSANTNLKQVSCTESQKTGITGVDESIIYIVPDDSDDGEDGNEDGDDGEDGNEDGDVELE